MASHPSSPASVSPSAPDDQTASLSRRRLLGGALALSPLSAIARPTTPARTRPADERPVLRVGPDQPVKTLAAAAASAKPGMVVEVQAGDYLGDVATWAQDGLTLRAVGGRVRVIGNGAHAQGKGLFVTTGRDQRIEGFDFIGARVPDRNGAGIRLERGTLVLEDCRFEDNENGLLAANDPTITLTLVGCEFGTIAPGEGRTHNCYVGAIGQLRVLRSYFHHGQTGHLLKSRAAVNHVLHNRLTDETGRASFELEFPNGGLAVVMGNVIQQSATTENFHLIAYGSEGLAGPRHELHLINNTLVDVRRPPGPWLRVAEGVQKVRLVNNLLAGRRELPPGAGWEQHHNYFVEPAAFIAADQYDYRLPLTSPLRGRGIDPGSLDGLALRPGLEYRHPRQVVDVPTGTPISPGAFQL